MAIRVSRAPGGFVSIDALRSLMHGAKRFVFSVPFVFCAIGAFFAFGAGVAPASKGIPIKYTRHAATMYDDDVAYIRLVRAEEKRDTDSYRNSSGTLQHSNKHVLGLVFKPLTGTSTAGGSGTMPTTGTTTSSTTSSTTSVTTGSTGLDGLGLMEELGVTTGSTGIDTTGSTGSTTGSTGGNETYYWYYIWVASPGEIAPINGRTPQLVDSARISAGVPAGVGGQIFDGEEAYVHKAATGPISGGTVTVTLETEAFTYVPDDPFTVPDEEHWEEDSYFQTVVYDVTKYDCDDASIDTRKGFGVPNRAGELAEDPNAEAAALNFGDWIWKGGLFVGNMPYQTGDQSGLARAQLYPQTSSRTTPCRLATLSMFYRGTAPDVTTAVTLGTYIPGASDTYLNTTASNVKWPTRWDIQPRTTPGSPRDDSKDPVFRMTFPTSTLTNEYANWQLSTVTMTDSTSPIRAFKGIGIAIENEDTFVTTPATCWRYFASQEFESDFSTFPENDSAPRLWVVDYDSQSSYSHHWSP